MHNSRIVLNALNLLAFLVLAAMLLGCDGNNREKEYLNFFRTEQNGLSKDFIHNSIHIKCTYEPSSYLAFKQKALETNIRQGGVNSDDSFTKNSYIKLDFSIDGKEVESYFMRDEQLYVNYQNYLNSYVYNDVFICLRQDTIPAIASIYARQYGSTNKSSVMVVFSKNEMDLKGGFSVVYKGNKFGLGSIVFPFTADALGHIPSLPY